MENIRIQDDLYTHVNQETLDKLVIPDDMPSIGGFATLATEIRELMMGEFAKMSKDGKYPNDYLKRACTLYAVAMNVEKKNADGIAPALKHLSVIERLDSVKRFNENLVQMVLQSLPLPFDFMVMADMKNTQQNLLYVAAPGVILPDATYYKPKMEKQKEALIGLWSNMAKMILAKTDLSEADQAKYLEDTLAFDAILAKYVKTNEESSDYVALYNPMKTSKLCSWMKPVKFKKALRDILGTLPKTIVVTEPRYFKAFDKIFNKKNFELYKHWAYVTGLIRSTSLLSEELRALGGTYSRALSGVGAVTPVDKFAYELASGMYSEPVGVYYGEKYFGEEAKKDITEIVYQIIDMYKERIKNNDFLGKKTKEKAILKLSKIGVKMGYPDKVDPYYNELVFDESKSLFEIVQDLRRIRLMHNINELNKPVNRDEWGMPGHMVNASYNPFVNDITFPAAILQAPFYSLKQSRSENLGGIGAVIGHEISHAFDSNGAKCDENGNINNWWTKKDMRRFQKKINAMVKQFDKIELPWGTVNGKFIVSENMADNGGMAVTLAIMANTEGASYEEYFKNWAKVWCVKAKPEYQALLLSVDVHGPAILRANMQPRNFKEWYETFDVKKTDKMYIAPKKRVVIW